MCQGVPQRKALLNTNGLDINLIGLFDQISCLPDKDGTVKTALSVCATLRAVLSFLGLCVLFSIFCFTFHPFIFVSSSIFTNSDVCILCRVGHFIFDDLIVRDTRTFSHCATHQSTNHGQLELQN